MPGKMGIALHRLVLSLSEALDWVRSDTADQRQRLTYIALRIAQQMEVRPGELRDMFLAAALQEPVLKGVSHSVSCDEACERAETVGADQVAAAAVAPAMELLESVAWTARCRRVRWEHGAGDEVDGRPVRLASHILGVADSVSKVVDRNFPVLAQAESITKQITAETGRTHHHAPVAAFEQLARTEAFWLDCISPRLHGLIVARIDWPAMSVRHPVIRHIAKVFGQMVDSLSPWTAGHSAGVAATAVCLAELMGFCSGEQAAMRLAGWLHDMGKLSVPAHVLDKNDRLSRQEWAVVRGHPYYTYQILNSVGGPRRIVEWAGFHHERTDGKGYPFGLGGDALSVGARIMAVADAWTAVMQDRPYRPGMAVDKAIGLIASMATHGALDGDVVDVLTANCDRIEKRRKAAGSGCIPATAAGWG